MSAPSEIKTPNDGAIYWRKFIGVETLPAISKGKKPHSLLKTGDKYSWDKYKSESVTDEEFEFWLNNNWFDSGICILPGKIRHRSDRAHLYYIVIDGDKSDGIKELLTRNGYTPTLSEVAKKWIVEQHADNQEKAHFGFYSPIPFPDKASDSIIGLEVRCGSENIVNRVVIVSPSIHKDGHPYEIIGTKDPVVLTVDQALQLKQHINQICIRNGVEYLTKTGNSRLDAKLKRMIKKITIDDTIEIIEGCRNDILIAIADSILFNHSHKFPEDKLREYFDNINQQLCKPDPLDDKELNGLWERACKFVEENKAIGNGNFTPLTSEVDEQQESADIGQPIPEGIKSNLQNDVYKIVTYNPMVLIVAHQGTKQVIKAIVKRLDLGMLSGYTLIWKDAIIDAIPIKIIKNDNPLDGNTTYKITFAYQGSKKPFTIGPASISYIIEELQNRARLLKKAEAADALTAILIKSEGLNRIEVNDRIPTAGYYYIDNKIIGYDVVQNLDLDPTKAEDRIEILECIKTIGELYNRNKNKNVYATVLKWSTLAAFSYVKKCVDPSDSNWLPFLQPYGWTRTGKNTMGKIVLAVCRKLTKKDMQEHIIGFGNVNTDARLGRALGLSTYPKLVNEVGALGTEKYYPIVELVKHAAESLTVRGGFKGNSKYGNESALCPLILTSNSPPPTDPAYRIRVMPLRFDRIHETTQEEKEDFNKWAFEEANIQKLGTLGDFASKYIIANPTILKDGWESIGKTIIIEFYKSVEMQPPEWIDLFEKENVIEQSNDETYFGLRGFLEEAIIEGYRRDFKIDPNVATLSVEQRLGHCLEYRSIPYLFLHKPRVRGMPTQDPPEMIAITWNIIPELLKKKIPNISTLAGLAAEIPNFQYRDLKIGKNTKKVVYGTLADFKKFLECDIEETKEEE